MLSLQNVSVKAGRFLLKDISLHIESNTYHAIIGPSGSGKTLLLNTISGFTKVAAGRILLHQTEIHTLRPEKRNIAYLFQDLALFPHMDVFNNIAFPLKIKNTNREEIRKRVEEYMEFTKISHLKTRDIVNLSGGEKQRVALCRILVTGYPLILLDEPFSAIDTQLQPELLKLLRNISLLQKTIIHVTHNYNEIASLAKTATVLDNGSVIQNGTLNDLVDNPANNFVAGFCRNDISHF